MGRDRNLHLFLGDQRGDTLLDARRVVPGKLKATDLKAGSQKTVQGSELLLSTTDGVTVNGAKVVAADVAADNGVIDAIDTVLIPK